MNPNRKLTIDQAEQLRQQVAENEKLPIRPRFIELWLIDEDTGKLISKKTILYPRRGRAPDPRELRVELRTKKGRAIGTPRDREHMRDNGRQKYRRLKSEIAREAGIHPSTLSRILSDKTYGGFR